jgi:cell division protein FtsW
VSAAALRARAESALAPLDRPLTSYYLLLSCTGLLLAIGLVMVLSVSSASQLDSGASAYSVFAYQSLGAAAGVAIMWLLSRMPPALFRALARPLFVAAIASLVLVLAFGTTVSGAERWISIAGTGIRVQPSEFAKLAFLIWGADLLARKDKLGQLRDWRALLIPLLPGSALIGLLVVLGDDLGTTFLLLVILLALLWVVGTPARLFVGMLGLIIFALLVLIVVAQYRNSRISGFIDTSAGGPVGPNMQAIQGQWALGSGGLFGVGLGHSTQKWGWVPYDGTDFIFSILGEELGLVGTATVVLLYGGLAYAGLRVARRVREPFMRFAATAAVAWIVGQAIVNISGVIHLLPITGVPLPLISQGLSSVLATLAAIGMLLAFARHEPEARAALARPGGPRRWPPALTWLQPAGEAGESAAPPPRGRPAVPSGKPRLAPEAGRRRAAPQASAVRTTRSRSRAQPDQAPVRSWPPSQPGRNRLADPGSTSAPGGRPGQLGPAGRAGPAGRTARPGPARQGGRPRQHDSEV